ncbi:hypothetical protein LP419_10240 [Massilia sp. H-1]|nr:hypothetical protein LP419_10240 [Massilia sp. H-1]
MDRRVALPILAPAQPPVGYIPTPTAAYRQHRKTAAVLLEPGPPRHPPGAEPLPVPFGLGARADVEAGSLGR